MAIDTTVPGSPGWWAHRLWNDLKAKQPEYARLWSYYDGKPPLVGGTANQRAAFYTFQHQSRSNFAALLVEAGVERSSVRSIKTAADSDENGDQVAWAMWRGNDLDVDSSEVDRWAWIFGEAYYSESAGVDGGEPVIRGEDPRQVTVALDPLRRREAVAAFKIFHDDTRDLDLAYLWLRGDQTGSGKGEMWVATRSRRSRGGEVSFAPSSYNWSPFAEDVSSTASVDLNALVLSERYESPGVPVHRVVGPAGKSAIAPHTDLLDRINHMILQRLVIATMQAFRQRGLKVPEGIELPEVDDAGQKINYDDLFSADPGALWRLPDGIDVWESAVVDLTPILSSVKDDVLHLAAVSQTPLSMFMPDTANQTAEGASAQREGIVFKVEDYQLACDRILARVLATAFVFKGDTERSDPATISIDWAPVERFSLSEKASADAQSTLPFADKCRVIWQMTPAEVAQAKSNRADDLVYAQQLAVIQAAAHPTPASPAPIAVNGG